MTQENPSLPTYNVLLISENPEESEHYSNMIRKMAHCNIDLVTQAHGTLQRGDYLPYHLVIISARELQSVKELAYVDEVTGLYNTRYLNTLLDREISKYQITKKPFAIL